MRKKTVFIKVLLDRKLFFFNFIFCDSNNLAHNTEVTSIALSCSLRDSKLCGLKLTEFQFGLNYISRA